MLQWLPSPGRLPAARRRPGRAPAERWRCAMLGRSIPFYNMILRCGAPPAGPLLLPEGYRIRPYQPGDERALGAAGAGDRGLSRSGPGGGVLCFPVLPGSGRGAEAMPLRRGPPGTGGGLLHRVAGPAGRGLRLLPALAGGGVRPPAAGAWKCPLPAGTSGVSGAGRVSAYLHTQPWSYGALLLYVRLGFRLQRKDTFSGYENQYVQGMRTLRRILPAEAYRLLADSAEP